MAMLRTQYAELFFQKLPYMQTVYQEDGAMFPEMWSQIFNVEGTNRMRDDFTSVAGLGTLQEISEGQTFPSDQFLPGFSKTLQAKQFALLVEMSKLVIEDDEFGVFSRVPRALSRVIKVTKEVYFWNILNNGLASIGTELTPDGVSIFNTAHLYVDPLAGTYSNYAASDVDETSLEAALTSFMDQTDDRGNPIMIRAAKIWVASQNIWNLSRLLDSGQRSGMMSNDVNAFSKIVPYLQYDWSPYITDPDSAFVVAEKSAHRLIAKIRQDAELDYDVDFRTKTAMVSADMRFVGGAGSGVGLYGFSGS